MRLTRLAGTCTVLAIPCALLLAQEPRPLESPEEAGRKAEVEAATQAEQALEKSLKDLRARRKELAEEGPGRRSAADIPELEEGGRIVNGVATIEFPGVGALVKGASPDSAGSWCTGTLVGCRTFLTANHCVRADRRPGSYHVYFQNLGFVAVEAVSPPHPDYAFPHADLAVLRLAQPVDGLPVTAINRAFTVPNQTPGTLVAGSVAGGAFGPSSFTPKTSTRRARTPGTRARPKTVRRSKPARRAAEASRGPTVAPAWSMARWKPKARPRSPSGVTAARIASRGAPRTPFPTRSASRTKSTWSGLVATATSGRAKVEIA